MRGQDNWINAHDYIMNQLFKYDYNNEEHLHLLKLKFWVLDDEILKEEGLIDNDYDNSLNHKEILKNELTFLDRYIRTKDKKLEKDEESFSTLVRERKIAQRDFVNEINPETGKKYEKWEQEYSNRPTTLSNAQFQNIYNEYKKKEKAGELSSAYEITSKLDSITIDNRKAQWETSIMLYVKPEIQEETLKVSASEEKKKEDIHFVKEMNRAHEELIRIIKELVPEDPQEILGIKPKEEEDKDEDSSSDDTTTKLPPPVITGTTVICNFPTMRVNVGEKKNDPSHKGLIIEQLGEGGYRFRTKLAEDLVTDFELPPPDLDLYTNSVNPFLDNSVEWGFDDWLYAYYYTITTTSVEGGTDGDSSPEIKVTSTSYLKPLGIDKNSLSPEKRARFDELNKRWRNLNELRERQMSNIGSRYQLESMFNASVPDIMSDLKKVFNDRKEEKENITRILRDFCLFGEFK